MIKLVIVDDHSLFLEGLKELTSHFENVKLLYSADSGEQLLDKLSSNSEKPDIILLDMHMKALNGIDTLKEVKKIDATINVLMLTMMADSDFILRALQSGASGYLLKDVKPDILEEALDHTYKNGFYYTPEVNKLVLHSLQSPKEMILKDKEIEFLKLVCSELTYREIATKMYVAPRTVDGYRESLFQKLGLKSRTGLVLYAVKTGICKIGTG